MNWLEKSRNQEKFNKYVNENFDFDLYYFKDNSEESFNKIGLKNKAAKKGTIIKLNKFLKYAAAISFWLFQDIF